MKKAKGRQEQVNTKPLPPEAEIPEFSLEEILLEFGSAREQEPSASLQVQEVWDAILQEALELIGETPRSRPAGPGACQEGQNREAEGVCAPPPPPSRPSVSPMEPEASPERESGFSVAPFRPVELPGKAPVGAEPSTDRPAPQTAAPETVREQKGASPLKQNASPEREPLPERESSPEQKASPEQSASPEREPLPEQESSPEQNASLEHDPLPEREILPDGSRPEPVITLVTAPPAGETAEAGGKKSGRKKKEKKTAAEKPENRPAAAETTEHTTPSGPKRPPKAPVAVTTEQAVQSWVNRLYSARIRLPLCIMISAVIFIVSCLGAGAFPGLLDGQTISVVAALLWLVCILLAYDVIAKGLRQLLSLRFGPEALVTLAAVLIAVDAVQSVTSGSGNYCAVGAMEMTFALWGMREGWRGKLASVRTVDNLEQPLAVRRSEKAWDGDNGLFTAAADLETFHEQCRRKDLAKRVIGVLVPCTIALTLLLALALKLAVGRPFIRSWMILLLAATPLSIFVCYNRLLSILSRSLERIDAAISGWAGARAFRGRHTVLLKDEDLFPENCVLFNGVKLCGGHKADQVIAYAAAATEAAGSPLAPLFDKLCMEQNCRRFRAGAYRYYGGGGIGAQVGEDVVLMGTLPFINSMGVHKDAGMKVKQAIYLSVNGELAGVFAVKYKADNSVWAGLTAMVEDGHFDLVMTTRDFLITPELMEQKYGIPQKLFIYPGVQDRLELPRKVLEGNEQGAIIRQASFSTFAITACAGRALYTGTILGLAITILSGFVGTAVMGALLYFGAFETAAVLNLTVFLLTWLIPELLTIRWVKRLCKKIIGPNQNKEANK